MGELLGFMYESCQELGLIKELLKLPLGLSEQVRERSECSITLVNISVCRFLLPTLSGYVLKRA